MLLNKNFSPESRRFDRPASSGMLQRAGSATALIGSNYEMTLRAKRELGEKRFRQFEL